VGDEDDVRMGALRCDRAGETKRMGNATPVSFQRVAATRAAEEESGRCCKHVRGM
jgi:hypothetical protein